jgi:hypothetical protein
VLNRETSIDDDTAHGERIDRVVTRNGEDAPPIRHDYVLAFADDPAATTERYS